MSGVGTLRADRLVPDDVIRHRGRPYRVQLVRLVPDDPAQRRPACVEIEAAPFSHDGAALVRRYEPSEEVLTGLGPQAVPTRPRAARPGTTGHGVGWLLALPLAIALGAHAAPVRLHDCGTGHAVHRILFGARCRLEVAPLLFAPRARWRS